MAKSYRDLLASGRIGGLEFRNRMFLTAMGVNLAEPDGYCGDRLIAFHEEQAKGGAALVMTGVVGVSWPHGGNLRLQVALSDDRFIPGVAAVAQAVKKHGARYAVQLHHGGLVSPEDAAAGRPVWVPSMPKPRMGDMIEGFLLEELQASPIAKMMAMQIHEMTGEDIRRAIDDFASAADRARRAGADAVEIHGGHGYLLSSFLSPNSNRRTDEYGGALENRARFPLAVLRAVRESVGADFPVWIKLDAREHGIPEGISLEDACMTARMAEAAGADAITVTSYHDTSIGRRHSDSNTPDQPGRNLADAAVIRTAVRIPVIASGRIELNVGNKAIADERIDFFSMGRKLLADPGLPNKLAAKAEAAIRPCVYCYTCISAIYTDDPLRCAVNPMVGFERELHLKPAEKPRHVAVIGGGPGGMEAARLLAMRGHRVTLLEKGERLGGTLQFAAIAHAPNELLLDWLRAQVVRAPIDIRLAQEATTAKIDALRPDAVIVATGARRDLIGIEGAGRPNVLSGDDLRQLVLGSDFEGVKDKTGLVTRMIAKAGAITGLNASPSVIREATRRWMPLGRDIVIIGGELVGLELAEFLLHRGRNVCIVDDVPRFGKGLPIVRRWRVLADIRDAGGRMFLSARDIAIGDRVVMCLDSSGAAQSLPADHVIVAKGARADLALADTLAAAGYEVHAVGDCRGVGYIEGAMRSAAEVAVAI